MADPYVGEIRMFAGNFAPRSYAFCDGQLLSISQNDALFSLLGTLYGGDGRTTFGLPDMQGRVPVHRGTGPGLTNRREGQKGGSENEVISLAQIPSHTHVLGAAGDLDPVEQQDSPGDHLLGNSGAQPAYIADDPETEANEYSAPDTDMADDALSEFNGGNQQHTNMMPYQCIHFIIALFGVYPSRN